MQNLSFNEARWLYRPHLLATQPVVAAPVPKTGSQLYPAAIALEELSIIGDLGNFAGYEGMEATRAVRHGISHGLHKVENGVRIIGDHVIHDLNKKLHFDHWFMLI